MTRVSLDENQAEACRKRGWTVGTHLRGVGDYDVLIIRITALGEQCVLGRTVTRNGVRDHDREHSWTLGLRDWAPVDGEAS